MVARRPIDDPTALDMLSSITKWVKLAISGVRFGSVITYDPVQRVADVQPGRRRRVWRTQQELPVIKQAPVGWWRFGQMVLVGELQPGDEVLLLTCERELRPWFLQGGIVDSDSERMHDPNDTVVLPWLSSLSRPITVGAPGTFYMGREDGLASVTIAHPPSPVPITTIEGTGPGSIRLGSGAVEPVLLGATVAGAFTTWTAAVATAGATHAAIVPPTAASNGAFIGSLVTATATLALTIASWTAIKTVAE